MITIKQGIVLDLLLEGKFGMIPEKTIPIVDDLYNFIKQMAIYQDKLIFFGEFVSAEKFYFYWRDKLVCFSFVRNRTPYFMFEIITSTIHPIVEYVDI